MSETKLLGRLGVWLCDHYHPRPATKSENDQITQYTQLVINVLRGQCDDYGRDRRETMNKNEIMTNNPVYILVFEDHSSRCISVESLHKEVLHRDPKTNTREHPGNNFISRLDQIKRIYPTCIHWFVVFLDDLMKG